MTLPEAVVDEAARLTRAGRRASDENEAAACRERRAELLAAHGYTGRVREEEAGATLVCYPSEWVEDGTVNMDRIGDTDRAVERPLDGDSVTDDDWPAIEAHNRELAERIADENGPVHGANAHAFADFMSNHYARRIETATRSEREEFLEEYFPRNAWPDDKQRAAVERTLELVDDAPP